MATKTYDEYEVDEIAKAKKRGDDYATQRKAQADESVKTSDGVYDAAMETAKRDADASVKETEASYRGVYDANAVSELVACRNVEEAMANMGLTDSGLNRTQQTAISLQRGRADTQTTQQKQSAIDAIMRELDNYRTQNTAEKAAASRNIYAQADADISNYRNNEEALARQNAASLYAADQEAEAASIKAEQEAAEKQAQYNLDMLKLGYVYDDTAGGYVKQETSTGGLTDAQIKIAVDYANSNGISYADAVKEIFGVTVSGSNSYAGYSSLNDAAKAHYDTNKYRVKNSIKTEAEARYSGDMQIYRVYPAYVASVITDAVVSGKLTVDEAAELRIELEAENGYDLDPYMQF